MSQNLSTGQTLLPPTQNPQPSKFWGEVPDAAGATKPVRFSVDAYADRLMDELFGEVEASLEMRSQPELQPAPTEAAVPSKTPEPASNQDANLVVQPEPLLFLPLEPEVAEIELPPAAPAPVRKGGRSLDRLLLAIGSLSVVIALAIWLLAQDKFVTAPVATSPVAPEPAVATNSEFADYAQQALQAIHDRAKSSPTKGQAPNATLPTVAVPEKLKPVPTPRSVPRSATGLERIFPSIPPLPMPSAATTVTPTTPAPNTSSAPVAKAPESPAVPVVKRTLVGLLELGDRSAALVEINGVVQRFRVGESVSSSGWALVEVSKNQVLIRRNGEVRSVFIGQNF
jgi:hypothetical protein